MTYTVDTRQLATALSLTERRVNQLVKQGVLQRLTNDDGSLIENSFDLESSVDTYLTFKRTRLEKSSAEQTKDEHKLKLLVARAEQARVRATALREDLHSAQITKDMMVAFWSYAGHTVHKMVQDVKGRLVGQRDIATVAEILETAVYEVLTDISNFDDIAFQKLCPQYTEGDVSL
jgi:plasmid maintenance system antidote protein VapI